MTSNSDDVWADRQTPIKWRDMAEHYRKENERLVREGVAAIAAEHVAHLEAVIKSYEVYRNEQWAEIDRLKAELKRLQSSV